MTTFTILVGFGLMLFLPCALTVLGTRDDDQSAYADRFVSPTMDNLVPQVLSVAASSSVAEDGLISASRLPETPMPDGREGTATLHPWQQSHQACILRNEMEALLATAAAARAQANALAANARLASAKAEAANVSATVAEQSAAVAIEDLNRAA